MPPSIEIAVKSRHHENAVTLKPDINESGYCLPEGHDWNSVVFPPRLTVRILSPGAKEALMRLERLKSLKPDWDSYGGIAASSETLGRARAFILLADAKVWPVYFVSPGPNGEVLVQLRSTPKKEAEVYFLPDGRTDLLLCEGDGFPYEGPFDTKELEAFWS